MNFDPQPIDIAESLKNWGIIFGVLLTLGLSIGFLLSAILNTKDGISRYFVGLGEGMQDTFGMSCRRIGAIVRLTVKESVRRKALLVFVVFAILFMFGGWFLSNVNERDELQLGVYVSFVLKAISWLVLPVALLLSCWSIPEDIRLRSLHTVVTKPVRRSEIVVGRVLGFSVIGSLIVGIMSGLGYIWILRQVPPTVGDKLIARVPVYGKLSFLDRQGLDAKSGVNTGDINEFRSYIEGASKARAIWRFEGLSDDALRTNPENQQPELLIENNFQAFRTHKGEINQVLNYQLTLVNDAKKLRVALPSFPVQEFGENLRWIPRELSYYDEEAQASKQVDLFDLVDEDGKLTMEIACVDAGQFLGMAQPDMFVRLPDRSFASTFFKSALGIWMMMALIIVLGVTASTFVKGPVATLLTFTLVLFGAPAHGFLNDLVSGKVKRGGLIESGIGILTHANPNVDSQAGGTGITKGVDRAMSGFVWGVSHLVPDFSQFRYTEYSARGFDVPMKSAILPGVFLLLGFLLPCFLLAYFSLKLRELEAK